VGYESCIRQIEDDATVLKKLGYRILLLAKPTFFRSGQRTQRMVASHGIGGFAADPYGRPRKLAVGPMGVCLTLPLNIKWSEQRPPPRLTSQRTHASQKSGYWRGGVPFRLPLPFA